MAYLSRILNSKVRDSADAVVGRLKDVLIQPQTGVYDPLKFLLVRGSRETEKYIPYEFVENISQGEVTLKSLSAKVPTAKPAGEFVLLSRDVLDQQIVDVEGVRVVRVNDLKLGLFEEKMCVLGIDVSFKGLLRRLGFSFVDVLNLFKVHLIDWRKTQPVHGTLKLNTLSKGLTKLHPADLANIIEDLNIKNASTLVKSLDVEAAAKVMEEMEPQYQKIFINILGPEKAAKILEKMSSEEIVDLLKSMRKVEARHLLSFFQNGKLKKVEELFKYKDDTAGGLMTMDYISAKPEWTAGQAVEEVRLKSATMRSILYIYVVDEQGIFRGAVSLRRLMVAPPEKKMKDLVKIFSKHSTLNPSYKIDEIVKVMTKYDLYTAVVLDRNKKLLGVVAIDDIMREIKPKA